MTTWIYKGKFYEDGDPNAPAEMIEDIRGRGLPNGWTSTPPSSEGSTPDDSTPIDGVTTADLTLIDGVTPELAQALQEAGFTSVLSVANADLAALDDVPGIGEKTAVKIQTAAKGLLG